MLEQVKPTDPTVPYVHRLVMGNPADEIVRLAEEENADLIVMATHGRTGIGRVLMGSVAEAVVRRARAIGADLVVGEAHAHRLAARPFLQNTDWELIRHCPQPLLLLKGGRRYDAANVLVAVDPFHAADKPASLDRALVASGQRTASALGGTLHLVHAWMPLAASLPTVASAPTPVYLPRDVEAGHEKQVRKAFDRLASRAGAKPAARHLVEGPVQGAIESAARRTRASIVVMGAISRRGLRRLFIGNTAERLLGHLDCDVLVVKPPGFRTQVPARGTPLPPKVLPLAY